MKLVITGSRAISAAGVEFARAAVARAKTLGWEIIVGDAPGVDAVVIAEANKLGVKVTVFGANYKMRHRTKAGINWMGGLSYAKRDKHMARLGDCCLAIWNGTSKGAKATVDYAQSIGKETWIKKFEGRS